MDLELLAEKAATVERHLERVADRLPAAAEDFLPSTDASDAVILHLWQAVHSTLTTALALCVRLKLETPAAYDDAFRSLAEADVLEPGLAERLARATDFHYLVMHACEGLDMERVHDAALRGPADLRAFFAAARKVL